VIERKFVKIILPVAPRDPDCPDGPVGPGCPVAPKPFNNIKTISNHHDIPLINHATFSDSFLRTGC